MKNLNTVFPFYDAVLEQYRYKKGIGAVPFILCATDKLVPFIIRRPHSAGTTANISVFVTPCNGGPSYEIHGDDFGLTITSGTSYDHIYYAGTSLPADLPAQYGGYYLNVHDKTSDKHWYSETFGVRSSMTGYLYVEFKNDIELGGIAAYFIQGIYIDTVMVAPIYIREDEGEKRDGLLVKEKQIKMKAKVIRWTMAPEYLTDALIRLDMQDYVAFIENSETTTVLQVTVKDPEWTTESMGLYAKFEIELIYDVEIKKLNFKETGYSDPGGNMAEIRQGYGFTVADGDDFTLVVVFDEPVSSSLYSPGFYSQARYAPTEVQWPKVVDGTQTENGFTVKTDIASFVAWTVILV